MRPAAGGTYSLIQRLAVSPVVQYIRRTPVTGTVSALWRFLHRDHLGSVDAISSSSATVVERVSFDGFGGRREKTWVSDITAASTTALLASEDELSPRGFTDHEMLNRTGFVHMNGRVYDPRIGRFVSADPIVQFPAFSQSYNRYSYTLNSPLSFVDPSGFMSADTFEGSGGSLFGQLSAPNIPGSLGGESSQDSERIVLLKVAGSSTGMRRWECLELVVRTSSYTFNDRELLSPWWWRQVETCS
ncbi:MAG: RHS repeat-associated core domain-containing protein [Pseudomonadales bacterium]